tara:strand:+ start:168 stop:359 length:192 start_codon:yes stop_codon:yes gene_type:complete
VIDLNSNLDLIGAIFAGFTAKNVISYKTECMSEEVVQEFARLAKPKVISPFCSFLSSKSPKSL